MERVAHRRRVEKISEGRVTRTSTVARSAHASARGPPAVPWSPAVSAGGERKPAEQFGEHPPRPPHWGGYRLKPDRWEFWVGRQPTASTALTRAAGRRRGWLMVGPPEHRGGLQPLPAQGHRAFFSTADAPPPPAAAPDAPGASQASGTSTKALRHAGAAPASGGGQP
jgi:hypothetical protein